jgi:chemotaxis methyl-accepting protein methylase
MAKDKNENKPLKLNYNNPSVVFTNHVAITKASNEEVELAICVKSPDEKTADVISRVIVTLPHFFRMRDVFNSVAEDIAGQLKLEQEKIEPKK